MEFIDYFRYFFECDGFDFYLSIGVLFSVKFYGKFVFIEKDFLLFNCVKEIVYLIMNED